MLDKLDTIAEFRKDHRKVLTEHFSQQKLDELGGHFAQSRTEGVPLLSLADNL